MRGLNAACAHAEGWWGHDHMSCLETLSAYGLRALGFGERLLPRGDYTLCEHVALIGSGMLWNIYFAVIAIGLGFFAATALAFALIHPSRWVRAPATAYVYLFRGTPLFVQFFVVYEAFVLLPKLTATLDLGLFTLTAETRWLTRAWAGATLVLFLNTTAYVTHIFHGALRTAPVGLREAGEALGLPRRQINRLILRPTMLRIAWSSYTNEAIFLLHATSLVFVSSFPAWRQQGDALYYASYFADKTFNPFIAFPIVAVYFILATWIMTWILSRIGSKLIRP